MSRQRGGLQRVMAAMVEREMRGHRVDDWETGITAQGHMQVRLTLPDGRRQLLILPGAEGTGRCLKNNRAMLRRCLRGAM